MDVKIDHINAMPVMCDGGGYGIKTWWGYEEENAPFYNMNYKVTIADTSNLHEVNTIHESDYLIHSKPITSLFKL